MGEMVKQIAALQDYESYQVAFERLLRDLRADEQETGPDESQTW